MYTVPLQCIRMYCILCTQSTFFCVYLQELMSLL